MTWLLVATGGAIGALARYLTDRALQSHPDAALPWGTLAVNVAGSLLLGSIAGAGAHQPGWVGQLAGTGFCGALTTYSTFGFETVWLVRSGLRPYAMIYVLATLVGGLGGAAAGWVAAAALTG